ncbi:unnamed protein product [Prunus armeniaca]|uniref:Uncharacterized protein n=1 Tax=Prunus armeniaca TaxID=36596 RepID=A0A6J5VDQ3_PRUAR|nr:unnamed protein product [Prunus armeniaca]
MEPVIQEIILHNTSSWNFSVDRRSFSSQAGAESSGEKMTWKMDSLTMKRVEPSQHELELSENGADSMRKDHQGRNVSELFKAILAFPGVLCHELLISGLKQEMI